MTSKDHKDGKDRYLLAAIVAALIGLVGAIIPVFFTDKGSTTGSTDAQASPSPTVTSPAASAPRSPDGTPSSPPSSQLSDSGPRPASPVGDAAAGPAEVQYLSDLDAIQGDSTTRVSKLDDGRQTREFNSSVTASINAFSARKTFVYTIDNDVKVFRATIGIDISTKPGAVVTFRVYLNDRAVGAGYTLRMQQTKELAVPVSGKSQLKLVTEVVESGGVGSSGRATWGDARFTMT